MKANDKKYSKKAIVGSDKFKEYRDFLNAYLESAKMYSIKEIENIITGFLKGGM